MDTDKIQQHNEDEALKKEKLAALETAKLQFDATIKGAAHVSKTVKSEGAKSRAHTHKVEVVNQPKLEVKHTNDFTPLVKPLNEVISRLDKLPSKIVIPKQEKTTSVEVSNLRDYSAQLSAVVDAIESKNYSPSISVKAPSVKVDSPEVKIDVEGLAKRLDKILKALSTPEKLDLSSVNEGLAKVVSTLNNLSFPVPNYVLPFSKAGKATQVVLDSNGNVPISGTIAVDTTGLATSAIQTDGSQKTQLVDAGGEAVTITGGKLDVNATISGAGGGTSSIDDTAFTAASDSGTPIMGFATSDSVDAGDVGVLAMDTARNLKVTAQNLPTTVDTNSGSKSASTLRVVLATDQPALTNKLLVTPDLPSGASTGAKQDTGNTSLSSIDTKTPALGQALAASSVPVVLTAAQITTLTPPAAITGFATAAAQTDKSQFTKLTDGTDTALITASGEQNVLESNSTAIKTAVEKIDDIVSGTGANISQVGGTNIDTNSGTKSAGTQRVVLATDQPQLTNALKVDGSAVTQPVSGTFWQATQPVSGTVTANLGTANVTNAGVFAVQATIAAGATNIAKAEDVASADGDVGVPAMAVRKGTPANTSGTDGDYEMLQMSAGRLWTSATVDAALPAGNNNIGDVDVATLPVAFNTGTRSATTQRVTIATDDSVPVTGTFWQATQPVSLATNTPTLQSGSTTAVTQATAANLNATVVGTGTFAVQTTPTAPTTVYNGKKTVTTAGTRVTLAASQAVKSVVIKALSTNTGFIYVGDGSVASTTGLQLQAGETVSLDIANLATVNLDSSVNGEGVTYIGTN